MKSSLPPNCLWTRLKRTRRRRKGVRSAILRSLSHRAFLPCRAISRLDAIHEQFESLRNEEEDGDPALAHRPGEDGGLAARGIGDARAGIEGDEEASHLLVHVAQRKDGEEPAGRVARDVLGDALDVGCEVAMGEHDALRVAGCAGSEHDLDEVFGRDVHFLGWRHVGDGIFQLLKGNFGYAEVYVSLWGEAGCEGELWLGARDHPLHVVGRASEVEGDDDYSCSDAAEEDEDPVRKVRSPEDYLVSFCEAAALEQGGDFAGVFPQAGVSPTEISEDRLDEEGVAGSVLFNGSAKEIDEGVADRTCGCVGGHG